MIKKSSRKISGLYDKCKCDVCGKTGLRRSEIDYSTAWVSGSAIHIISVIMTTRIVFGELYQDDRVWANLCPGCFKSMSKWIDSQKKE